jgi:hypothetical protein
LPRADTLPIVDDTVEPVQHQPLSSSVGDYVKAIWEVAGLGAASTKDLSVRLSVADEARGDSANIKRKGRRED